MKQCSARLVVVSGPDGAGKTTLMGALAGRLWGQGLRVGVASLWDLSRMPGLPRMFGSAEDAHRYLAAVGPQSRLHFLLHCLHGALDRAAAQRGLDLLLFDAYWYKYAAAELCHGLELDDALAAVAGFPQPAAILQLDAPPEVTAARKRSLSLYECGLRGPTRGDFVAFQAKLRPALSALVRLQSCPVVHLDATQPPAASLSQALAAMAWLDRSLRQDAAA